jgi:nucleotide-binding universal stress UspA family protein
MDLPKSFPGVAEQPTEGGTCMAWFREKRVLVPFDFSAESTSAVQMALTLAETPEDVFVLHVLPEMTATEPGVVWGTIDDEHRCQHAHAELRKRLESLNATGIHAEVAIGNPGHVIAEQAEKTAAGLIIIPSHGRTGMKRLLLGSVAERVVRLAKCPVLVLKPER